MFIDTLQGLRQNAARAKRENAGTLRYRNRSYLNDDVLVLANRDDPLGRPFYFSDWETDAETSHYLPSPCTQGLQGKTWLCLHECPAGEKPGVIPDIKIWARKHAYPIPIAPAVQPEYPYSETED